MNGSGQAPDPGPSLAGREPVVLPDEEAGIPQDFAILLEEAADLAAPVEVERTAEASLYRSAGRDFAVASGLVLDVDVGPDIAAAATRTPDTTTSSRGPGWVRLAPRIIDDHAADRALAWFEMARRIAVGRRPPDTGPRRA